MTGLPHFEYKVYGREVSDYAEDMGFVVTGHDRRSMAALNWRLRDALGAGTHVDVDSIKKRWIIAYETCGCTEEQHAKHGAEVPDDYLDLDNIFGDCIAHCDDARNGLPPCNDTYSWMCESAKPSDPGAIPILEWLW